MATEAEKIAERLEQIDKGLSTGPWSKAALYEAIRHVQRNTDVMENAVEYQEQGLPTGIPDRYDGEAIAILRNMLPEIIQALKGKAS